MRGDGRMAKNPKKTIARLLSYMNQYRATMAVVIVCILLTAVAQVAASKSLEYVVEDYIKPLLGQSTPDFGPLIRFLCVMACVYIVGMVSSFLYNFLMVKVGQGTQKTIRDAMFTHMQRLPIRYFDTHPAGDVMSRYTNDIDTLRQMISQAIPQCISSVVTIVVVFIAMVITSPLLTLVVLASVTGILFVTKRVTGKSARFFIGQQRALGAVNGYVEEMINGQRVVKVFCHEEKAKEDFDALNDTLRENAYKAGAYSNMMGPINNNLGYIQYAILAIIGGFIVISSQEKLLTTGALMSFMLLSRSFNMPIGQVSNQINAIVMALAGGIINGFCYATVVRGGACTGGTDFVAAIIHKKKPNTDFFWVVFILNAGVAVVSYFVYDFKIEPVLLCVIYCYLSSAVGDRVLKTGKSAIKFEIVTHAPAALSAEILHKLGHGVTVLDGRGMYSGKETSVLFCVINRNQVVDLERIIRRYPGTFAYLSSVSEVVGNFKQVKKHPRQEETGLQ